MAWNVELSESADRELDKLEPLALDAVAVAALKPPGCIEKDHP
jgi:hypothetical protein